MAELTTLVAACTPSSTCLVHSRMRARPHHQRALPSSEK
jgi:hypothetical protein